MIEWWQQPLAALNEEQWEALCDGCGRCCMIKLMDEDTDEVVYTDVVCHLLDLESVRCTRYPERHRLVPDCVNFGSQQAQDFTWLPETCAYRIRAQGQPLPEWHPLRTGDQQSVVEAGISVVGRVISEEYVHADDLQSRIVQWVEHGAEPSQPEAQENEQEEGV